MNGPLGGCAVASIELQKKKIKIRILILINVCLEMAPYCQILPRLHELTRIEYDEFCLRLIASSSCLWFFSSCSL